MEFVVVAMLTTLVAGIPVTLAVDRSARGAALIGLSYLYGCGVVWASLFALSLLHIRWTPASTTVVLVASSAAMWALVLFRPGRAAAPSAVSSDRGPLPMLGPAADVATAYTIVTFAMYATIARVWEWDFWAIWGLKARIFVEAGGIDWRFLKSPFNDFAHPDYPLLLPLNYAYAALLNGQWDDSWMALPWVAFTVALVLIARSLAARELPFAAAAILTFAAAGTALSQYVGLADAPLIAYGSAAVLFIRRFVRFDDSAALRHGAILLGLAASTKNEGLALVVSVVLAMLVGRLSKWRDVLRLWPAAAIALPWIVARFAIQVQTDIARGSFVSRAIERLADLVAIAAALLRSLPDPWLWLALLIGIVLIPRAARGAERFVFAALLIQAVWYVAAYFGTPLDVRWHIQTSWPRVARHLEPALLFVVMIGLAEAFARGQTSAHAEARSELR